MFTKPPQKTKQKTNKKNHFWRFIDCSWTHRIRENLSMGFGDVSRISSERITVILFELYEALVLSK